MMTDPIADMLTRIRNAVSVERPQVEMPVSKVKQGVAEVLKREGYIWDFECEDGSPVGCLKIELKYGPSGEKVIRKIRRVSKPGCRVYVGKGEIPEVRNGLGLAILSTSRGIVSSDQARELALGGEVICEVW